MNHEKPVVGSGMTTNNDEWGRMVCHGPVTFRSACEWGCGLSVAQCPAEKQWLGWHVGNEAQSSLPLVPFG